MSLSRDTFVGRHSDAPRDTVESAFGTILRDLCKAVTGCHASVLVDPEGECVDYYTRRDLYETRVVAAQIHATLLGTERSIEEVHIEATLASFYALRLRARYWLVIWLESNMLHLQHLRLIRATATTLCREAGWNELTQTSALAVDINAGGWPVRLYAQALSAEVTAVGRFRVDGKAGYLLSFPDLANRESSNVPTEIRVVQHDDGWQEVE